MLPTEDTLGGTDERVGNLDTLSAEDVEPDANLDDSLLRRDLKSRLFGSSTTVHIGRYEILRRIGRGGMGTVYVAHDPELDRKVALKVLRPDRRSGRDRMLQEARALARLAHPNVVTVHEVGVHDDRVFVAMEFVEGVTLRAWLEGSPARAEVLSVFTQAARGLQAAHRAGLVHRDFKPENVLIGDDGRVRVVDFGVVKTAALSDPHSHGTSLASAPASAEPDLTLTGQLLGTPAYMAAEQFLGHAVDARTDVFAFCVSLYEALAGRRPFAGTDFGAISRAVLEGQHAPLTASDVPRPLADLLDRGLSRDVDDRPDSMDGLLDALDPVIAPAVALRPWIRSAAGFAGVTLGTLMLGGVAFASLFVMQEAQTERAGAVEPATTGEEPPGDPADAAEAEAFASLIEASDEARRHAAATHYLEAFESSAPPARRAIAHSIIGDVLWRASCPTAMLGLCAEERPLIADDRSCRLSTHGPLRPRDRDPGKAEQARTHLEHALSLAGVERPEDPAERDLFGTAIGRARVQRTDATLETYLGIQAPQSLDFVGAEALSSEAFKAYFARSTELGAELVRDYASVKRAGSPQWVLTAAARTGLLSEKFAADLGTIPVPEQFDAQTRGAYCDALTGYVQSPLKTAHDAYAYCLQKAEQFEVEQPEVEFCRTRLADLDANADADADANADADADTEE